MDFQATLFADFPTLPDDIRGLLRNMFEAGSESEAAIKWASLTSAHDDQAASLLAVFGALTRIISVNGTEMTGSSFVQRLHLLAGDRMYARLSQTLFDQWRQNGRFRIGLPDGRIENGVVKFNRGQFGASLHRGFDIQGVTAVNRIPRIQWNYRLCDGLADIDLDGFSPFNPFQHLTYANSDCRQWYDRYKEKFGDARFAVERVGNVPELRIEDTSVCRLADGHLTPSEQGQALTAANAISQTVATSNDVREWAEPSRSQLELVLRDAELSPLDGEVSDEVRAEAPEDDLFGYYAARLDIEISFRVSHPPASLEARSASEGQDRVPIATNEGLRARRLELEAQATMFREFSRSRPADPNAQRISTERTRAWLSRADTPAFGYAAGTRFVAAETATLQLLFAPQNHGYRLLFAVPRTKY